MALIYVHNTTSLERVHTDYFLPPYWDLRKANGVNKVLPSSPSGELTLRTCLSGFVVGDFPIYVLRYYENARNSIKL